ncbi:LacI family DNA-binding transcriptional regulator [Fusibacter paucivorans]|uniref:LacI family DNA-binding transcriptional regulator n=1 Tax=Fusibacter paucivorans TaxID=76009 RepID=A0ABS5PQT1_9FIRM|nr:LacI family DNA-binding transcriptional regulator [Fusibacter paucivorans]MBS7527520.1 LacI family DNA-binding transcriptional regulator [Fusibacter paucivorans]
MKKATIKDVAKMANVSVATVSRVLNKVDYPVSDAVKKKVEDAIEELEYTPSKSAQSLKSNKSQLIGLIVRDIADPYFSAIAKGVTESAIAYGYLALVCNSKRDMENELKYYDVLMQHNVAGIVIAGAGYRDEAFQQAQEIRVKRARELGIPIIALAPQNVAMTTISVDNHYVGQLLGNYLVENGHHHIAYVGGNAEIIVDQQRLDGFLSAMRTAGIQQDTTLITHGDFTWEAGYKAMENFSDRLHEITAICCANDNIAIGVLRYLKENNLIIPENISLVSVGDIIITEYTTPKLSTVKIPFYELGEKSVEIICDPNVQSDELPHYEAKLIKRNSVARRCKL